jgi:hypothetical protein
VEVLEPALHREQAPAGAVGDQAPQPPPGGQGDQDRDRAEQDQVPGAVAGQGLLQHEEDDGTDDRPFDRAHPADDDDEDHERGPVDAERRLRLHPQQVQVDHRAGQRAAERRHQVDQELGAEHVHAEALGARLVVADGGQRQAEAATQQQVTEGHGADPHGQGQLVGGEQAGGAVVGRGGPQGQARAAAELGDVADHQPVDLGDDPGADGEVAAA